MCQLPIFVDIHRNGHFKSFQSNLRWMVRSEAALMDQKADNMSRLPEIKKLGLFPSLNFGEKKIGGETNMSRLPEIKSLDYWKV